MGTPIGHHRVGSMEPRPSVRHVKWPEEYSDQLLGYFDADLFDTDPSLTEHPESTSRYIRINFAAFHRMRLRKLRIQLANRAMAMHFKRVEPEDWEDLLKEYITAHRDYKYIQGCATGNSDDPFYFTNATPLDRDFLRQELEKVPLFHREAQMEWENVDHLGDPIYDKEFDDIRGNMNLTVKKENLALRVFMATFGGAFLIGPMWLMVLRDDLKTTLITATAFVTAFGLFISVVPFFIKLKGLVIGTDTVLSATAAYAAVLVVFVGTSQSKSLS